MKRLAVLVLLLAATAQPGRATGSVQLAFACDGHPGTIGAMENEYAALTGKGPCWFHLGHHTYDMGSPYRLGHVQGSLFSVEVEYSPPTDLSPEGALLAFEASSDGLAWEAIHEMTFDLALDRQQIEFAFDAGSVLARYMRIRQPHSAAQGLSGYLDGSSFTIDAEPVEAIFPPPPGVPSASLSCANDLMERFFAAHPCWFGGVNRYDAPSVFHTYPIGASTLERIAGTAVFLPWRTDDYNGSASRTDLVAYVQVSSDSHHWSTVGSMTGKYGAPVAFDFQGLRGLGASFVRLVAEYHHGYRSDPALKHVRGMLLDSALTLTGELAF